MWRWMVPTKNAPASIQTSGKKTTKIQTSYCLERVCTYPKWTPFTVTFIIQTRKPTYLLHQHVSPFKLTKVDLWVKPTGSFIQNTKNHWLWWFSKTVNVELSSSSSHKRSSTTQLLYHPATDQNKGAQLRRENGQFQQQEEVPLSALRTRPSGTRDCFGTKWGQVMVGCFFS